ncbi:MYG1 family protein [Chlamydia sp. 17-3921]|uniref:MYG1 family protein n=1 Tax=Chlamydia sp. 17-3921 TaxID=2675798 RepID=UPI00191B28BD|nr:MYG1 family protein [Chlamydia sp. 17-3921]
MQILRSVGTHDGSFHADEVTACALLIIFDLVDEEKIIRSRNPKELEKCEYVCDVGGIYSLKDKRFDHHQLSYVGPWSSAGMVLHYLQQIGALDSEEYHFLNNTLIRGVDDQDNGRFFSAEGFCSFSDIIKIYNPKEEENSKKDFFIALHFTMDFLRRLREKFRYDRACREIVRDAMEKERLCLFFDHPLAWQENFFFLGGASHPAAFVCFPSCDQWILRGIPPNLDRRMEVRIPFPKSWAGLLGEELSKVSQIPGAVFCHKGLFLSVWTNQESCRRALQVTLEKRGIV